MGDNVYKTIEITGSSTSGVEEAVTGAIAKASETYATSTGSRSRRSVGTSRTEASPTTRSG